MTGADVYGLHVSSVLSLRGFAKVSPSENGSDLHWLIRLEDGTSPNHPRKHIRSNHNVVAQRHVRT